MIAKRSTRLSYVSAVAALLLASCGPGGEELDPRLAEEAPIGDVDEGQGKADGFGHWGEKDHSETCKPIPEVEPLIDPMVTVSIDGRSVHLVDRQGDYDRVFAVGLGKIGSKGESISPVSTSGDDGLYHLRGDYTAVKDGATSAKRRWAWNYRCRIWSGSKYYNPRSKKKEYRSYFAGLPFIRIQGPARAVYGLHGPIDRYWKSSGGLLYRGYVSGGCMRMRADDLLELFGRIKGHKTPIKIQHAIEFDAAGLAVDPHRFIGAHCLKDKDCVGEGAVCAEDPAGGGRFCAKGCTEQSDCPFMKEGVPGAGVYSYCVADEHDLFETPGYCVIEGNKKTNNDCRSYPASFDKRRLEVLGQEGKKRNVCALPAPEVVVPTSDDEPGGDKPAGDKSARDKPAGDEPAEDEPAEDKPAE